MRFLPIIAFIALIFGLVVALTAPSDRERAEAMVNRPLAKLSLTALDGKSQFGNLKGKVTVLNVLASWCTPCAAELPELAALKKQLPAISLQGVAWNDKPDALKPWLKKHKNPFDAVWIDQTGDTAIALGIKGIPETFIIDTNGVVRYRLSGIITPSVREHTIVPLLKQLIAEASDAP